MAFATDDKNHVAERASATQFHRPSSSSSSSRSLPSSSTAAMTTNMRPQLAMMSSTSSASSSSSLNQDLPELLDQSVKEAFQLGFASAVQHSALRNLTTIREAVLGVDRIKHLITEGCSPEMIATMIASKDELKRGFQQVEGDVRDLALGFTVLQVATQFDATTLSDDPSPDAVRLARFQRLIQGLKADPIKNHVDFPKLDYTDVLTFVQVEKLNGTLAGDPAWEEIKSRKRNKTTWKDQLMLSIDALDRGFQQAADEIDWTATSHIDMTLLEAIPAASLISLALSNYERTTARLSLGPQEATQTSPLVDADNLSRLGVDFRSDALDLCKRIANESFSQGDMERAQHLYELTLRAGSNDASVAINRAAALLKQCRYKEAQECCSMGLLQLQIARLHQGKSGTKSEGDQIHPSPRSRPMLASQDTQDELRWKALVRRGRAHKGILLRMGGLRRSSSGDSGGDDDDEDDSDEVGLNEDEETSRAEERGRLLLAARSDFAAALRIDPLDDIPRQEMNSLTIDPLQRRPSGQDITKGLALASISQVDKQKRRESTGRPPVEQ